MKDHECYQAWNEVIFKEPSAETGRVTITQEAQHVPSGCITLRPSPEGLCPSAALEPFVPNPLESTLVFSSHGSSIRSGASCVRSLQGPRLTRVEEQGASRNTTEKPTQSHRLWQMVSVLTQADEIPRKYFLRTCCGPAGCCPRKRHSRPGHQEGLATWKQHHPHKDGVAIAEHRDGRDLT